MRKLIILILLLLVSVSASLYNNKTSDVLSKKGSTGNEVIQIQKKLKNWGYYNGDIDGIYGSKTKTAVEKFQRKNGLKVDGIAGTNTLNAMGIQSSSNYNYDNDAKLLARIINAEARGESYVGQVSVGAVVLNRVKHPSFPNTIAGVIFQEGAFTAIVDGQWNANMYESSYKAAQDALNGWDPTGGAIYYYNPAKTTSKWIYSRPVITTIGKHVFAK
ncbi:MAG: spore cortex-lytic enzyme [Clostridia bacterium]|nr:spore cortex-lytic enzyme [Clostridia bacterium]